MHHRYLTIRRTLNLTGRTGHYGLGAHAILVVVMVEEEVETVRKLHVEVEEVSDIESPVHDCQNQV